MFANGTEVVSVRAAADQSLLLHGVFDPVTSGIPSETLAWVLKQELSTVPSMQVRDPEPQVCLVSMRCRLLQAAWC